jgi:hypothetical protein
MLQSASWHLPSILLSTYQAGEAYRIVKRRGSHIVYTVGSQMAVIVASPTRRPRSAP